MTWQQTWLDAGILEDVIERFDASYVTPPQWLTDAICADDNHMGYKDLSIAYTNDDIRRHDKEMFLAEHGFPITTNLETQTEFLEENAERAASGLLWAVVGIPVGIVGSVGGYLLGINQGWW